MVIGRFKGYVKAVDKYLLYCKSRSKWLVDTGYLFNLGVVMLFVFNFVDVVETYYSVTIDGRFLEGNILAAPFVDNLFLFLFLKLFMISFALLILMVVRRYSGVYLASLMLWLLAGYSMDVIIKNLVLLLTVLKM